MSKKNHPQNPAAPEQASASATSADPAMSCAEDNAWAPILPPDSGADDDVLARLRRVDPAQDPLRLSLKDFVGSGKADDFPTLIPPEAFQMIRDTRRMSFHALGCSGDPAVQAPQAAVADAMIDMLHHNNSPAFLFHLGDIVYKTSTDSQTEDTEGPLHGGRLLQMYYSNEFYAAYRGYNRPIFAIPGNHDGKYKFEVDQTGQPGSKVHLKKSPMWHFLRSFCAERMDTSLANDDAAGDPTRPTMTQPYPYFVLTTPVASIIGLYTNVMNGGGLDLGASGNYKGTQYRWFVERLKETAGKRKNDGRAIILATHYPPFSGAANFPVRGNPQAANTPGSKPPLPLAAVLLSAFEEAGVWPDIVLSAHAHLYQRLTLTVPARNRGNGPAEIPFVIAGCGGHSPAEYLWHNCAGAPVPVAPPPFPAVWPSGYQLPKGYGCNVVAYNDQDFGFLNITVDLSQRVLTGEFITAYMLRPELGPGRVRKDVFQLNLDTHTITQ